MSLSVCQPPVGVLASAPPAPAPQASAAPTAGVDREAALEVARQFVGEAFFGLLLKELRKSTSKDHLLYGGRGEETLQPLLDQYIGQRLAESRHFDLAEAVAGRLCARRPRAGQSARGDAGSPAPDRRPS